ncbi:flagellar hook assembly protein FlgD [Undibacterium danionis]|uniref:Basal-body rod modification protein FlgD n=1 Tax=Undibacterium danionis TaxID=1812100 RepID=A0ABV6I9I1_9BURK
MSTVNTQTTQTVDPSLLASMNGSRTTKTTAQEAQDRFMTLLVTQMKNQDPLNPLDNAQVTSQLAQLSTVTGIDKLNETMTAMSGSFKSTQSLQAANMIGHGVVVPGTNVELKDGKSVLGFDLPQNADKVRVLIKDQSGAVVKTVDSTSMTSGFNSVVWDGKTDAGGNAANGNYKFEVTASSGETKLTVTPLSFGLVSSVSFGTQGTMLSVLNTGEVAMSDVRQVF